MKKKCKNHDISTIIPLALSYTYNSKIQFHFHIRPLLWGILLHYFAVQRTTGLRLSGFHPIVLPDSLKFSTLQCTKFY